MGRQLDMSETQGGHVKEDTQGTTWKLVAFNSEQKFFQKWGKNWAILIKNYILGKILNTEDVQKNNFNFLFGKGQK